MNITGDKMEKTNVMRLLEQKKIKYQVHECKNAEGLTGVQIAKILNEESDRAFKTLVTVSKSNKNYVFVIPVEAELDLKKAAKVAGEKSIDMIKQKELLPLTGYIHGGCSPIGMKKAFPTFIHETAKTYETIYYSAGKIGIQVETAPTDLEKMIRINYADIVCD